jgi:hypothetical protein
MKRHFSTALTLLFVAALTSLAGCASGPNNNNANIAVATPEPTPDKAAIETELTRIENDWPRIIKERDGATVRRIEADDIVIIYPDGSLGNKEQDAKDIEAGLFTFDSWDTLEVKVNVIDKNLAVVTLRYEVKKAIVRSADGKASMDMSGQYLSLDTFARRNGQWQFIALSSVKIKPEVLAAMPKPSPSPTATTPPTSVAPTPVAPTSVAPRPAASRPAATPRSSPVSRPTPAAGPSLPRQTPVPRTTAAPAKTP